MWQRLFDEGEIDVGMDISCPVCVVPRHELRQRVLAHRLQHRETRPLVIGHLKSPHEALFDQLFQQARHVPAATVAGVAHTLSGLQRDSHRKKPPDGERAPARPGRGGRGSRQWSPRSSAGVPADRADRGSATAAVRPSAPVVPAAKGSRCVRRRARWRGATRRAAGRARRPRRHCGRRARSWVGPPGCGRRAGARPRCLPGWRATVDQRPAAATAPPGGVARPARAAGHGWW